MTIQVKAIEQYFPVVLFVMLYKVFITFESVNKIPKGNHSNESYGAELPCCVIMLYKVALTFSGMLRHVLKPNLHKI